MPVVLAASACSTIERGRTRVDVVESDEKCARAGSLDLAVGWPTSQLYTYTADRCEPVTQETFRIETRQSAPLWLTLGVVGAGGLGVATLGVGAVAAATRGRGNDPADTGGGAQVATQVAGWGGLLVGAAIGYGLTSLVERLSGSEHFEKFTTRKEPVDRRQRPLDTTVTLCAGGPTVTTSMGKATVEDSTLLALRLDQLSVDGTPQPLSDALLQKFLAAQACARGLDPTRPPLASLTRVQLTFALSDARVCFEAGVPAAEAPYSAMIVELHRRDAPGAPN